MLHPKVEESAVAAYIIVNKFRQQGLHVFYKSLPLFDFVYGVQACGQLKIFLIKLCRTYEQNMFTS